MTRNLLLGSLILATLAPLTGCAPMVVAGIGSGAMMASDRRTPGTYLVDEEIELTARGKLFNMKLEGVHINFTSFNRRVLVSGEAATPELRDQIIAMIQALPNVREVLNEIAVAAPTSLGVRTNDTYLTSKVKSRLFEDGRLNALHIKVVSENSVVYLMGMVKREEGNQAAEVTARSGGVTKVVKVFEYLD